MTEFENHDKSPGPSLSRGLDGVVITETRLSRVDGEHGRLVVRGLDIEDLALRAPFEAASALLWTGALPTTHQDLQRSLARARVQAFARIPRLGDALGSEDGMEALRAALGHLRAEVVTITDESAWWQERVRITAAVAVFAAAWARIRSGQEPVAPNAELSHAADLLQMIEDAQPQPERVRALDTYLATVVEHGMNASTFAARVVASTGSDPVSAVVAALGALKGPLHGGAPGPVLSMLDEIEVPERARPWLDSQLAAGERIMGMGHRVYRVRDPRAAVLERALVELERSGTDRGRLPLARAVEREATAALKELHPDRPLAANVEFYTAVLLDAIGLDRSQFTTTFAVARVVGWLAHIDEQLREGRLIRPTAHYVGPMPQAA